MVVLMTRTLMAAIACIIFAGSVFASEDKDVKYFRLVHVETGKVLSIANNSEEAEAKAVIAKEDEKNHSQQWKLDKVGDHYKLTNRKSGKVLDVNDESTEEGTDIIQWDDKAEGNDNQRWSWIGDGTERRLKSKSSGLVLDVNKEDEVIQKKANEKSKGQLWKMVEVK
jgi:hypothetical protein